MNMIMCKLCPVWSNIRIRWMAVTWSPPPPPPAAATPTAHLELSSVAYHSRRTTNTWRKSSEWTKSWHEIKANSTDEPLLDMHVLQRVNRIRVVGPRPCWASQAGNTWMQWCKQRKMSDNMRTSAHWSFRQLFTSLTMNLWMPATKIEVVTPFCIWTRGGLIVPNFGNFMVPPESTLFCHFSYSHRFYCHDNQIKTFHILLFQKARMKCPLLYQVCPRGS